MIPIRLSISGFLSYQQKTELDFTQFDLACISGQNGAGKSSILEAITWVLFGKARGQDDDSLLNEHQVPRQAEVQFEFEYERNYYRVTRTKAYRKTAGLDLQVKGQDGIWKPLTEKSIRMSEQAISRILKLDYDTFINASFFLQGKADEFTQKNPSERKKVLANILGLEIWDRYRDLAGEQRRQAELEQRLTDEHLKGIDNELAEEDERTEKLHQAEEKLRQLEEMRELHEKQLELARRIEESLEEKRRTLSLLERNRDEVSKRVASLRNQLTDTETKLNQIRARLANETDIQERQAAWKASRDALRKLDEMSLAFQEILTQRQAPERTIAAERSRLEEQLRGQKQRLEEVRTIKLALEKDRSLIPDLEAEVGRLTNDLQRMDGINEELHERLERNGNLEAQNSQLRKEMEELRERIERLDAATGAVCPLCGQVMGEEERTALIVRLRAEGTSLGDRYRANSAEMDTGRAKAAELARSLNSLRALEETQKQRTRELDQIQQRLNLSRQSVEQEAVLSERIEQLESDLEDEVYCVEERRLLARLDIKAAETGYDPELHASARREEQRLRQVERDLLDLEAARAALAPVEEQKASLKRMLNEEQRQYQAHDAEWSAASMDYQLQVEKAPDVDAMEREALRARSEENRSRAEVGSLRQRVEILGERRAERQRMEQVRQEQAQLAARLRFLEKAFGKDGVQALLIEQALPEIELQANELLDHLSAGQMSVRFDTQRQLKSREGSRETLDILITDGAGTRTYEMYSGGEAFRVNFAVRLALSQVLARRAGARLQTLFIDEGFGSQDADGRQRLLEAINLVRPQFERILVITHMEELKDAFPARVEVQKTPQGSQIEVFAG